MATNASSNGCAKKYMYIRWNVWSDIDVNDIVAVRELELVQQAKYIPSFD